MKPETTWMLAVIAVAGIGMPILAIIFAASGQTVVALAIAVMAVLLLMEGL